jgi:hypothetical protein
MNLDIIRIAPAQLVTPERLLLYALVYGLRPKHCLEIGTAQGGSALIICSALDEIGLGQLVIVDPAPQIAPEHWARMAHRAALIVGRSPEALSQAQQLAGSKFDFVFIDGDHSFEGVLKDIEGVIPLLDAGGYILLHDAHYFEVKEAIDEALRRYPFLTDCGMVSKEAHPTDHFYKNQRIIWAGFRLLRFNPLNEASIAIVEATKKLAALQEQLQDKDQTIADLQQRLTQIYNSTGWRLLEKYWRWVERYLPEGTRRRSWYNQVMRAFKNIFYRRDSNE